MTRLLLALLLFCASLGLHAQTDGLTPVPALQARVTDTAGLLSPEQRAALEQKLAAFEQRKGSQLGVLIVPTTAPEAIEQYGIRVAEQWQLGRKGTDDGIILIVARNDRTLRIEVGYGLEGVVPDAIARRVIAETIVPRFQAGDFAGGIVAGMDQLMALVDGEPLPPPAQPQGKQADNPLGLLVLAMLFLGQILRAVLGPVLGGALVGGGACAGALLLGANAGLAVAFGIGGFLVTALGLMSLLSQGGGYRGGGSSGGFGGGGFSGGGGGFGGGGASGRW